MWTRFKRSPFGMNCRTTHNVALFCLHPVNPARHKLQTHSAPWRTSEGQSSLPIDFLGDRVKSEHRSMFSGENYDPPDRFLPPTLPLPGTRTTTLDTYDLFGMWDSGSLRLITPCVQLWSEVMFTNNLMTRAKTRICNSNAPSQISRSRRQQSILAKLPLSPHTASFEFCYIKPLHHPSGLLDVSLSCIWKLYRPRTTLLSGRLTSLDFIFENLRRLRTTCVKIFYTLNAHTLFKSKPSHTSIIYNSKRWRYSDILMMTACDVTRDSNRPKYWDNSVKILYENHLVNLTPPYSPVIYEKGTARVFVRICEEKVCTSMRLWVISTSAANQWTWSYKEILCTHPRAVTGFDELQHPMRINVSSSV